MQQFENRQSHLFTELSKPYFFHFFHMLWKNVATWLKTSGGPNWNRMFSQGRIETDIQIEWKSITSWGIQKIKNTQSFVGGFSMENLGTMRFKKV